MVFSFLSDNYWMWILHDDTTEGFPEIKNDEFKEVNKTMFDANSSSDSPITHICTRGKILSWIVTIAPDLRYLKISDLDSVKCLEW